jgi:hypothetical protein
VETLSYLSLHLRRVEELTTEDMSGVIASLQFSTRLGGSMLAELDRFVDGRSLADTGLGVPSPPSPPHPPCLPGWDTTPGMPCLGPAPPSFELISEDDSTTILAFAVMGLVAVIGLTAFARERSRELHQGNKAPRLGNEFGRAWGCTLGSSTAAPLSFDARLLNQHRSLLRSSPLGSTGPRRKSKESVSKEGASLRSGGLRC